MSRGGGGGSGERIGEGRGSWEVSDRSDITLLSDNFLVICVSWPQGQQGPSVGGCRIFKPKLTVAKHGGTHTGSLPLATV